MKKKLNSHSNSSSPCRLTARRLLRVAFVVASSALGSFLIAPAFAKDVPQKLDASEVFPAGAGEHAAWGSDAPFRTTADAFYPQGLTDGQTPTQPATSTVPAGTGLHIIPFFDSSITGHPQAAAIESMIFSAVGIYESLFSDPITVRIYFRYTNTQPNGTPMGTALARSNFVIYNVGWTTFINNLIADARTANDNTANASLPGGSLSTNIVPSSANGRALNFNTPGTMDANGNVGSGTYDGIVTLNSNQPFQFNRPPSPGNYDALRSTEHEMDEVLGFGSHLNSGSSNLRPQDLFSWSSAGVRNTSSSGLRYFSINSGNTNIVGFSQDSNGDFGDWISPTCPQPNPFVQNAFSCQGQFSDVTATSPEGINLDVIGYDLGAPNPSPTPTPGPGGTVLGNISTRIRIETGSNVLIGGFIVTGTQAKRVILRAIGPSLPLAGAISDTVLELHDSSGALIVLNDDWRTDQEAEIIATGIPPTNNLESAIVRNLTPGAYTAIVYGYGGATGIGLVEAYDLDRNVDSKLANISTRGLVTTADNVLIGGTIIIGSNLTRVIFRAIGPSLANAGVPNALSDPTLELHDSNGAVIFFNDDWRSDQEAEIIATGLPPTNNLESAIVLNLAPAAYTAIVRGYSTHQGVALVEAYQLQ